LRQPSTCPSDPHLLDIADTAAGKINIANIVPSGRTGGTGATIWAGRSRELLGDWYPRWTRYL